ncbi:dUTP diphosphatase [Candidatus Woesebacteria bacterium]|nr:dUTP diphosphatase [Candidatus Woesebacteria bacterium]MCD8507310.1 dUTP diphosphatase [Candidatus Woesebacteria bacterium]MCD8527002.1 dUTP diphosphatase [Candidatus Woesebacteria bacterium]MCD8546758.1 dUTP diphosphatase [Candidatus Woesebacteria bacterium]
MPQLKIKLFDSTLPVPEYQTNGAVAFDLYARETTVIPSGAVAKVPLNVAIELPEGHWALLAARSSLHKKSLQLANGIGVGDADFCGDNDEYQAALRNFSTQDVTVEKGERIVQMIILPYARVDIDVVESLGNDDRGGFGSTGK